MTLRRTVALVTLVASINAFAQPKSFGQMYEDGNWGTRFGKLFGGIFMTIGAGALILGGGALTAYGIYEVTGASGAPPETPEYLEPIVGGVLFAAGILVLALAIRMFIERKQALGG